jgi:toxin ParE1/3/4
MSAPNRTLSFTAKAQQDFEDIVLSTAEQWGENQAVRYSLTLDRTFALLLAHPYVGPAYEGMVPGLRIRPVGHHIVFYRVLTDAIEIYRILHERTDPRRHL